MPTRISGKKIAEQIKIDIKKQISELNAEIIFSIIYVGQDPVIDNFIKYKKQFGADVGVTVVVHNFDADVDQKILTDEISNISKTSGAMIVQLPLPEHLDVKTVLDAVPAHLDVDVLGSAAVQNFAQGDTSMFPPVTGAMVAVLNDQNYSVVDKNIALLGYGNLVGKPFAAWLEHQKIAYSIITKETSQNTVNEILLNADVIVAGAGVPGLVQDDMISDNVVLLDGGTSEAGKKVIGDIDPSCYGKSLFYTPVPGGIGPITIAILYQNILTAFTSQKDHD
ncbi:MAG: tetrahydrofolate dehydrogenase/cyclohydrolase catalytic domain-containing protein [Minisyncoccia bacterium]